MAAKGGTVVSFVRVSGTAFYFADIDEDVGKDGFLSKGCSYPKWIKSANNKFLILNDNKEFQAQNLSMEEQECHPEHKFNIHIYKNSDPVGARGVILYACRDSKKVVVLCKDEVEVQAVEMKIPQRIAEAAHEAIFYQTKVSASCYLLESSLFRSRFLAFEPDKNNPTLKKLVLRHKDMHEVDVSCQITML